MASDQTHVDRVGHSEGVTSSRILNQINGGCEKDFDIQILIDDLETFLIEHPSWVTTLFSEDQYEELGSYSPSLEVLEKIAVALLAFEEKFKRKEGDWQPDYIENFISCFYDVISKSERPVTLLEYLSESQIKFIRKKGGVKSEIVRFWVRKARHKKNGQ